MKKLLSYLRFYRLEAILAPLLKMLEACFELFVPVVVASMIDDGILKADRHVIYTRAFILILLCAVGFSVSVLAQYFSAKAAAGFAKRVRHDLFKNIQSLSYSQLDRAGTSSLITGMTSDMNQVQQGVNMTLRLLLRSPFVVFGAMIMSFTIDVKEALIFAVVIPLLSAVVCIIMLWSIPRYKQIQAGLDGILMLVRENLSGVRVIRAFKREDFEKERFYRENGDLARLQERVGKISALMNPVTLLMVNTAIAILIYSGAVRVYAGILTQGKVVALYNYMSQILIELIKFASLILTITKAIACGNRVSAVLEMNDDMENGSEVPEKDQSGKITVEFSHVNMRYQGASDDTLTDISLHAETGEKIGIIGGTGSGKSTLVNLIPRFYDVSEGAVRINGRDVREYDVKSLREMIGMVSQSVSLFSGTIRDNLLWGNSGATDEELWEALELAQASDFVKKKAGGLDYVLEQAGKNLSGGQRQRLSIARALVRKPAILILDDSSSALDYQTEFLLRKALFSLDPSPVVFIVSQRTSSIRSCDRILVLDDGCTVGTGTHEELLKSCPEYREIHRSQSDETEEAV